jgi:hypothetical protein
MPQKLQTAAGTPAPEFNPSGLRYYDFNGNWLKIEPFVNRPNVREAIETNYNMYCLSSLGVPLGDMTLEQLYEFKLRTEYGDNWKNEDVDVRKGERQPWWVLSCPHSCHWLVNVALELAKLVEPDRPWRIISGKNHSTVWDGNETLFDLFYAINGVEPDECYISATTDGEEQPVGHRNDGHDTQPWWVPEDFEASQRKEYKMDVIAKNARVYLNNLVQSLKAGAAGKVDNNDAFTLAILCESTTKFLELHQQKRRERAAAALQQMAQFEVAPAAEAVKKKVERTAEKVLTTVLRVGNSIAFAEPKQFLNENLVVHGFKITEAGVIGLYGDDDGDPLKFLKEIITYSTLFRWDWALFVENKDHGPVGVWTFECFRANEWEPTKAVELAA